MYFEDFFYGLDEKEQKYLNIDGFHILDFLFGKHEGNDIKQHIFTSLQLEIHFAVKQFNRGKIESHLWFFKGF